MQFITRLLVAGSLAIGLSMGGAAARDLPSALAKLIGPATKEGKFNLTWGGSTLGGSRGAKRFESGFNAYYGTHIDFAYTPGLSFPALQGKLVEQYKAGQPAMMDIALAGIGQTGPFIKSGILSPLDWAAMAPEVPANILDKMVSPDRTLATFVSRATTIVYNPNIIKPEDAPRRLSDLLDPKWKGKIASTPYGAGFGVLALHPDWGVVKTLDFAKKLSANLAGLMRCGEHGRITSGEFPIFALACEPGRITQAADKGAPMAQNIPLDALQIDHWWVGVPKHAQHPNVARLFVAWLLTPQGQNVVYQNQGSDLNYLAGSRSAKVLDKAAADAGRPLQDLTIQLLVDNNQWHKLQVDTAKIFREAR